MSNPTNETDHDAPRRSPPRPSTYAPIEVDDPRLREVERQMAKQDTAFRETLDALAPIGRGLIPVERADLDALADLCAPTVRAPDGAPIPHAVRC